MTKTLKKLEQNNLPDLKNTLTQVRILFPQLKNVKDEEIIKAIKLAQTLELNPLKKEVHFVPYNGSVQLIVSYTEYIKRAERSGKLNGWNVKFGRDEIGEYADVVIHRKDWDYPFEWRTYLKEAQQNTPIWKKMPIFMLRKTAIAQAFRLAFPEETAELPYEEAEIPAEEPLSPAQKSYILDLLSQKGLSEEQIIEKTGKTIEQLTKHEASEVIEHLKNIQEEEITEIVEVDDEEDIPL